MLIYAVKASIVSHGTWMTQSKSRVVVGAPGLESVTRTGVHDIILSATFSER